MEPSSMPLFDPSRCSYCRNRPPQTSSKSSSDLKKCSRCGNASYCSHACQEAHWRIHKKTCSINLPRDRDDPDVGQFLFSSSTVDKIRQRVGGSATIDRYRNICDCYLTEILGKIDLVLHCSIASSKKQIGGYMGAYKPCAGNCDGMPIWSRDESLSRTISSKASQVADEGLVFTNTPNDAACYLTIGDARWMLTTGVRPETVENLPPALMSKNALADSSLRLALEPWHNETYFESHVPLTMVMTLCSFTPWFLRTDQLDEEIAVSIAVTPAVFVTRLLDIAGKVPKKPAPKQTRKVSADPMKEAAQKWLSGKNSQKPKKKAITYPSSIELWSTDVVVVMRCTLENHKVGPLIKSLSSVYAPIEGATKGDFPIWKKKATCETDSGDTELYLFVSENKYWCVSTISPENINFPDIVIQNTNAMPKSDIELAKIAYDYGADRITDEEATRKKVDQSMAFAKWTLYSSDLYEEVFVCVVPYTLWDPTKETCIIGSDGVKDSILRGPMGKPKNAANKKVPQIEHVQPTEAPTASKEVISKCSEEFALQACSRICSKLKLPAQGTCTKFTARWKGRHVNDFSVEELVSCIFSAGIAPCNWLLVNDSVTAPIIEAIFSPSTKVGIEVSDSIRSQGDILLQKVCADKRIKDMTALVNAGVPVTVDLLCEVFQDLPKGTNNQFANKLALETKFVVLKSKADYKRVTDVAADKLGKGPRRDLQSALKKGEEALKSARSTGPTKNDPHSLEIEDTEEHVQEESKGTTNAEDQAMSLVVPKRLEKHHAKIDDLLKWYEKALADSNDLTNMGVEEISDDSVSETSDHEVEFSHEDTRSAGDTSLSTSDQISLELERCEGLPKEEQEELIGMLERRIDLATWDTNSVELPVMITDQAHKWFQKRVKKHARLCERVIRRLRLLATGRRSYVLCKALTTSKKGIKLYESKIDAARRIIWEDKPAFSPRRSNGSNCFAEQTIYVWGIVEDHDNLSRAISLAIQRIEKSHTRGRHCMLFAELLNTDDAETMNNDEQVLIIPSVYSMREGICPISSDSDGYNDGRRLYPLANDDDKQYNLLKFYELNYDSVQLLLDKDGGDVDLPFTPGPKEHEIINFSTIPKKSILLMGRSGTGKTTCLVFRMWATFMAYRKKFHRPKILFLTKNDMLRNEIEKSFRNMGLAWLRRSKEFALRNSNNEDEEWPDDVVEGVPVFLISGELLDALDEKLPGNRFFTSKEARQRVAFRSGDDSVRRAVDSVLQETTGQNEREEVHREEMTYRVFRSCWPKINSKVRSRMDPALVWLEIKSYIKGCVDALQLDDDKRDEALHRFLSEQQYLALPKKQSRLDECQRTEVYQLFQAYEKLKKAENRYDEMDLVYNIAGRVVNVRDDGLLDSKCPLFEIDCIFVDEVQDFTQAELFLLTKLARDPDNLMLAGDTAQSIAVGVGFRFNDVKQIFYEKFHCKEPALLQLTHNYRSHAGVLRLAAAVLELLYFFFKDGVDRLPPDQGLFEGPKPVIMDASDVSQLVLIMEGSKRETARIEFGAHQVVIVRNEEAKERLPAEFNVDKEWVMTVQQCKGLEFDDVLLYNFFTDSEAKDMWRVISNYKEEDMQKHHSQEQTGISGVHKLTWDKLELESTRPLEFEKEKHKILESELKMLYTAITRARVNVFIAESDFAVCRPIFNYFRRRRVVDDVEQATKDTCANLRVFGNTSTPKDWQRQGEIYLQKAEGEDAKRMLNLAMRCFENAGDTRRINHTIAYLSFLEAADSFDHLNTSKRAKRAEGQASETFYKVAFQLLEAQDTALLKMAAECLIRIGDYELIHGARILELHARFCYAQTVRTKGMGKKGQQTRPVAPSRIEQSHFELAAKLFTKLMGVSKHSQKTYRVHLVDAVRNYLSTGLEEYIMVAADLVETNHRHYLYMFNELYPLLFEQPSGEKGRLMDPVSYFRCMMREKRVECKDFTEALTKISMMASRHYHRRSDEQGLRKAVSAIMDTGDRIKLLISLEGDSDDIISKMPWASHPVFRGAKSAPSNHMNPGGANSAPDLTRMITDELAKTGEFQRAGEVLERQGDFLAAAEEYSKVKGYDEPFALVKSLTCRVRYVELVLASCEPSKLQDPEFCRRHLELLQIPANLNQDLIPVGTRASGIVSISRLHTSSNNNLWWSLSNNLDGSFLWLLVGLRTLIGAFHFDNLMSCSSQLGTEFWQRSQLFTTTVCSVYPSINALLRPAEDRSQEQRFLVTQTESFFELQPDNVSMAHISTNNVWNIRLRECLQAEKKDLSELVHATNSSSLASSLERNKLHPVLAQHLCHAAILLLLEYEQWLAERATSYHCSPYVNRETSDIAGSIDGSKRIHFVDTIQARVVCLEEIQKLNRHKGIAALKPWWRKQVMIDANDKMEEGISRALRFICCNPSHTPAISSGVPNTERNIVEWRQSFLNILKREVMRRSDHLQIVQKEEDVNSLILLWRTITLCSGHEDAMQTIEKYLSQVEYHSRVVGDIQVNRNNHILPQKGKLKARNALSIGRLWSWALDYIHRDQPDLISAVKLISHLQWKIKWSRYLKPIDIDIQLTLLEANVAGLLGMLSHRFGSFQNGDGLWCVMPEHSFIETYLRGEECFYGRPLCETILATCQAHFFEISAVVGGFLQTICNTILHLGIMSMSSISEGGDVSVARFERVLFLSAVVSINAVVIHNFGRLEAIGNKASLIDFPFRTLNGDVRKLIRELLKTLFQRRNCPSRIQQLVLDIPVEDVTVADLTRIVQSALDNIRSDRLVPFRVDRQAHVETLAEANFGAFSGAKNVTFAQVIGSISDTDGEFEDDVSISPQKLSVSFANDSLDGVSISKEFGLSHKVVRDNGVLLTLDEIEALGREVKDRRAAFAIQRFWRLRQDGRSNPGRFFKGISQAFIRFQRIVRRNLMTDSLLHKNSEDGTHAASPLAATENLWNEERLKGAFDRWHTVVHSNNALFDGIECTYCDTVLDAKRRHRRVQWCKIQCEDQSYYQAARQFNFKHFGLPLAPFESDNLKKEHEHSDVHRRNIEKYNKKSDAQKADVCKTLAHMECSILMMQKLVRVGQEREESHPWYLELREEAYSVLAKLEPSFLSIRNAALYWPYPSNLEVTLRNARELSETSEAFFTEKVKQEVDVRKSVVE